MAGGGGGDVLPVSVSVSVSQRVQMKPRGGRRRHKPAACLPLDVIVEIAARSDAATLVRCAATCRGARRRIAEDPKLLARLRLRDAGRFLLPLLRGNLAGITRYERGRGKTAVCLVDLDTNTAAADSDSDTDTDTDTTTTRLVEATFASAAAEAERLTETMPVDSRGGLVLIRATATTGSPWQRWHDDKTKQQLLVCNPTTGRHLAFPPEPKPFPNVGYNPEQYVLLVGDGDVAAGAGTTVVGRPFQVLKAKLVLSNSNRRLMVQTISSEHGAWSPIKEIPTPNIHGRRICCASLLNKVMVVGDVVHWLCLTDAGSYVLMLHVTETRVSETTAPLPASFPRGDGPGRRSYLMTTDSAGGSPVVLVADAKNIRAWEQGNRTKTTKMVWKARPQVLIEREAIMRFGDEVAKIFEEEGMICVPELVWFGERSGVVFIRTPSCWLLLDLYSKKIVRCLSLQLDCRMLDAQPHCPYEVDSSSWMPTFSRVGTF